MTASTAASTRTRSSCGKEFGEVTFDYEVLPNGTLLLTPVMPACTASGCFAAQWAVAVAYPGLPWERVG